MSIFTTRPGADSSDSLLEAVNKAAGNVKPSKPVARPQKGSFVLPNAGPHKGQRHKVTHIHEDGTMTVVPWDVHPSQIKYRMGAAKATADQVEAIDEAAPNHPIPDLVAPYKDSEEAKGKYKYHSERAAQSSGDMKKYHNTEAAKWAKKATGIHEDIEVNEEIKGWKNAGADIAKFRRAASDAAKSVKLVKLKKDGTESKMHDATSHHADEDAAVKTHHRLRGLNPKQNMKHNLYIDHKLVRTLHEDVVTEGRTARAATASTRTGLANMNKGPGDLDKARSALAKIKDQYAALDAHPDSRTGKLAKQYSALDRAKVRHSTTLSKHGVNEQTLYELSQATLGKYLNKASTSAANADREGKTHSVVAKHLSTRDKEGAMHHGREAAKSFVTVAKRREGIVKAAGKLNERNLLNK